VSGGANGGANGEAPGADGAGNARDAREPESGAVQPGMLERRPVHSGRIVDLSIDTVRFPDGSVGELEFIRHSGAAAVLPVLSDPAGEDPQVLLIRQYRYASGGFMYEVPAGRPDQPGEDWEVCARRELHEEAGLVAGNLRYLTTIYTTPGFTDEQIRLYMATDCTAVEGSQQDADEFIEPVVLHVSQVLAMIRDGEITDAKTVCTIMYAAGFLMR
jgi:ADP-ribose pyrophosphatase